MKKTILCVIVSMMLLLTSLTFSVATHNESGPALEVRILTGFQFPNPSFRVDNIGDETAHNVELTDITVDGDILYNNRDMKIADEIESGHWTIDAANSWFIGYGVFSMVVTVTCDEGVFSSDETNGFIIGPFIFIL
jgi:hypothetical protein